MRRAFSGQQEPGRPKTGDERRENINSVAFQDYLIKFLELFSLPLDGGGLG
jgi:hypothetical protein